MSSVLDKFALLRYRIEIVTERCCPHGVQCESLRQIVDVMYCLTRPHYAYKTSGKRGKLRDRQGLTDRVPDNL